MKRLLMTLAAVCAGTALSMDPGTPKAPARHNMPEAVLSKTGGIVEKKGEGKVVVVNCQDLVAEPLIAERAARLGRLMKCGFEVRRGTWSISAGRPSDANFAIYVVNDPTMPMSLVATEAGWGAINTAGLDVGDRFSKQLTRVFALTVGGMNSRNVHSPMRPVTSAEQLDDVKSDDIMIDMIDALRINMKAHGMTQTRIASYRKACQEGWAPAPTNEYQQAIWDKVHTIPKNPMKIEFDPKKGR